MAGLHYLAAVAATSHPPRSAITAAARAALDDVVLGVLDVVDARVSLQVHERGSDLGPRAGTRVDLDWGRIDEADDLEGFAVAVTAPHAPPSGEGDLARVFGSLPGPRRLVDGSVGESETVVCWSVRRDAVAGRGLDRRFQDLAVSWLESTIAHLDGAAGYLTLDHVTASPDGYSPYEQATYRMAAQRRLDHDLWTHVWGLPLSADQVEALGGQGALPVEEGLARPLDGGRWWVQASEHIEDLTAEQIAESRDRLGLLLPPGMQDPTDYAEEPPLRV